ncbi:MAG: rhodanese-like domain-containing protein [Oscillospiraceae bacterium]
MKQRMKQLLPLLLAAVLLTGCAAAEGNNGYRQINAEEAAAMMEEEIGYIILDVRTVEEYSEKHIPGAVNIPNETIGSEDIPELPDKDQLILVYCRSGNRSKQAAEKLVKLGYTNIVEFGGINDWTGETVSGVS